jgi:signal transduction histidine kinase/ActR/RegA family two-component response regulator
MAPIFGSLAIYCVCLNSAYGWFGVVSIFGFMWLLWGEVGRSHRRVEELLRLRYESDRIASARAQALLEAEQLSQAKGRFLATMSHEMRTPLHGILGLSRLLRDELVSQEAHQRMNLLQGAGQHLLSVINDVLDFSRLQAGALELHLREVSLHELVQEVAALAQVNAQDKGVQVVLQSDLPPLFKVAVDVDRLKQVLHNLLGNAVKFTEQGQITVRLRREAGDSSTSALVFEVQDTGIGIPPEELGRVFDAFHQVDGSFERGHAGSGLGLSIAHEICVAMQGSLTCDSQMGVGSTFRCVLPLRTVGAPQEAAKPPATTGTSAARLPETTLPRPVLDSRSALQGTVLLVEDNPVNALVAQVELEQLGLQVALAENGCEALAWLAEHEADLVLMDCHMPEMNGFEATRRIRETESRRGSAAVPIIALTASARLEDHRHCLSAGMSDYLAKPFAHADLLRVVRRHLIKGACRTVLPVAPPVIQSAEGVVV